MTEHGLAGERRAKIHKEVLSERRHQDVTFGEQNHDPAYWATILMEQVGQAAQAVCDIRWGGGTMSRLRHQLIQVQAVALAATECLDRGTFADDITTAKPTDKRQLARALGRDDDMLVYDADEDEHYAKGKPNKPFVWDVPKREFCGVCGAKGNHDGVPHGDWVDEKRYSQGDE